MSESAGFVTIKDLTGATIATEDDDLIIQQGEETKRINLKTLGDLLVFLDKIEQVKTSTENGGINEIKATLSDGSTATFTTQNGHGIQKIEQTVKSDVSSGTNVITATLSDGQKSNFEIKNGDQGEKGDTGASLIDVVQKETSAVSGGKNVISFKLNDGSYKDVEVYNGAKGETGEVSQEVLNQTVNEAIAGVVANAPEDFDTLKEMSDWISEHEDDATAMNSAIQTNKTNIATEITNRTNADTNLQNQINNKADKNGSTADFQANTHYFKSLGLWNDFEYVVIPILEITSSIMDYRTSNGKIFGNRKNGYYKTPYFEWYCNKEYNATASEKYFLSVKGIYLWNVVTFIYDSKKYLGIAFNISTAALEVLYFDGYASSMNAPLFTVIKYYHTKNGVINQEIYNSLTTVTDYSYCGLAEKAIADGSGNNIENTYATKNNVQNYSTTPQKIGTWIDGKDVYRVVIENELEGNILGQLAGSVESGAKIISAKGQITDVMDDTYIVPCFSNNSSIGLRIKGNSIYFTGYSNTSFTNVKLVVEYTK